MIEGNIVDIGRGSSSLMDDQAAPGGGRTPDGRTPDGRTPDSQSRWKTEATLAEALVRHLADLGVAQAFGVSGGAVALVFDALVESEAIELHHFRHETGAAFAATEAYFASGEPTVVFATTGPGTLNALTGIMAARWDGAKVVLISGSTSSAQRGRWATQETSSYTLPQDALYSQGPIFDYAIRMESTAEFSEVARRLSLGLSRPGGFVAHVSLPMAVQSKRVDLPRAPHRAAVSPPTVTAEEAAKWARLLKEGSFAIWLGFGARAAAPLVEALVERSGARVFCSPRAKGILSEDHPNFLGVTGLGGHEAVIDYMVHDKPRWVLVLGTRLGEATSFWDLDMVPTGGFIHVDVDREVPGTAYPESATWGIHADVGCFLERLLEHFPAAPLKSRPSVIQRCREPIMMRLKGRTPVRPQVLMQSVQRQIVQASDAVVLAESGNSFAWTNHYLRFSAPGRYRVSTLYSSMGHAAAGVVGAALARRGKAVAIVGDGSMLMNSEISTAVQYQAPAVWIVLNDAGYSTCRGGHRALGLAEDDIDIPPVDFTALARSLGGDGVRVRTEGEVEAALGKALAARGPFVVDVAIDAGEPSPLAKRFASLVGQGEPQRPLARGGEAGREERSAASRYPTILSRHSAPQDRPFPA